MHTSVPPEAGGLWRFLRFSPAAWAACYGRLAGDPWPVSRVTRQAIGSKRKISSARRLGVPEPQKYAKAGGARTALTPEHTPLGLDENGLYGPIMPRRVSANEEIFGDSVAASRPMALAELPQTSQGRTLISSLLPTTAYKHICIIPQARPGIFLGWRGIRISQGESRESIEK